MDEHADSVPCTVIKVWTVASIGDDLAGCSIYIAG